MPGPPPNTSIAELANGLGLEDARDLVGIFLEGFDASLTALSAASREERRRAAHSLKSSAHIVGLIALSRQMAHLEDRLSATNGDVSPADIARAREQFEAEAPLLRTFAGRPAT